MYSSTMDNDDVVKMEVASSNGFPVVTIKEEGIENSSCKVSRRSVDSSIVKVEDGVEEYGTFEDITNATLEYEDAVINRSELTELNAEISPKTPFRLSIIDEDGNVLETYFENNGTLIPIPIAKENNMAIIDTENKKTCKKRRLNKLGLENLKYKQKSSKKFRTDEAFKNENYCCSLCKYECFGRKSFKKHLGQHIKEEDNRFECCFCDYGSSLRGHINRHIMQKHSPFQNLIDERMFTCKICKKSSLKKKI